MRTPETVALFRQTAPQVRLHLHVGTIAMIERGVMDGQFQLGAEPLLANTTGGYAPRPAYRPLTKFELRGLRLGHGVWDLVFRRV